ncbi:External NADH-ubiquinone oxidoreductase 2, mitochondrial [Komagataella phaffii CBS 7435]|uniref:Mitochondrial external NADH dehydrogenase, a type II NAD(P)H:quinone oxidoreductase n=2 Tax=Komagataella phaffii TaxID=460519 RepID=C4R5L0_KOMPG|nr:Mitochondrial external NADH dehydrogenase, a type II NAD(P)H:quinone oxidoreductase [Komagataella phaffii GS115]AOA64236.1 GQ67_03894T0 [Komagataella phaffii]CAH2449369.1 External NADH-ubiquinone oxidoreductase 2, mitochondrial [Komagataella phaffii CBS 7435]AOA68257.1 GQ68_03868T0 [Komagataella phaffii GS115]CAY70846.1 Mitochondrial external NADH dehydrogenase, a type II NAD(P)H:quinone oxidoreductase [Komagataella phaffii GS115]CCA39363.1 External NADH-ubiquinone oxidoreductase 2, mitocho
MILFAARHLAMTKSTGHFPLAAHRYIARCHFKPESLVQKARLARSFGSSGPSSKPDSQAKDIVPKKKSFWNTFLGVLVKRTVIGAGIISSSVVTLLVAFFIYDSQTYNQDCCNENLQVPKFALDPETGGPENLPILRSQLDAMDTDSKKQAYRKPKLVILGSGWGSVALLNNLNPSDYDVTVVSPTNYFLFTPMLPCAAVGTLEIKTLMESIRSILRSVNGHYLQGYADKILFDEKLVQISCKGSDDSNQKFYLPYDKLVVAVGSTSNTHGVTGLQYCHQLKTAADALQIKRQIVGNLEKACLPTTTDEERKRLLSFVVCGGGPTGVELAAEIFDLLNEDLTATYPKILKQEVSIHIIQSRSHVLNTYDKTISEYAMKRFENDNIDLLTNARVNEILPNEVVFNQKNSITGELETKTVPFGLCVWSTGVSQNPLAQSVTASLSEHQHNKRAIQTDAHLRVLGAPLGDVYAIGDCATVKTDLAEHTVEYIRHYVVNKYFNQRSQRNQIITDDDIMHLLLSHSELMELKRHISTKHPLASESLEFISELIPKYDTGNTGKLSFDQITRLLKEIDSKVTSLPATAQRAHQQGTYLGKKLSKLTSSNTTLSIDTIMKGDIDDAIAKPFKYQHLGSLAYIGNSAVFDLPGRSFVGGLVAMYLWRGIYFAQSVSMRTRVLLFMDWLNRGIFGRTCISI